MDHRMDHSNSSPLNNYVCHCFMSDEESWTFAGTTLSEMSTSVTLPTSHHFHPSLSPVVSLFLGILHEWMRMQMLAKPSSNLLQRTGGDHRGGRTRPGWRTFMMTCLHWILGYMRLEIWHKVGLSGDWYLCTALRTRSGAGYCWIGLYCFMSHSIHKRVISEIQSNLLKWIALWLDYEYPLIHV